MTDRRRAAALLLLVTAIVVAVMYGNLLRSDLMLDDYVALRPRSAAELWGVWHGTWEPRGLWPVFFRPLSIWYYSALFHVFGLASVPLRVISLMELTIASWGIGVFVRRETGSLALGLFGAVLFAMHPAMAHAGVAFIFLQNHLLSSLVVMAGLLAWQSKRLTPTLRSWWPLLLWGVVGALVKEDVLMLVLLLPALQAARARVLRDVPMPSLALAVAAIVTFAGYALGRQWLLGELGGSVDRPDAVEALRNVLRGPFRALIEFQGVYFENGWALRAASACSCAWLIAGVLALLRRGQFADRALAITGAILLIGFSVPLLLMSNMWRYHLVSLAATLLLVAAVALVTHTTATRLTRALAGIAAAITLVCMAVASTEILQPLAPCGVDALALDREITGSLDPGTPAGYERTPWPISADELAWVRTRAEQCAGGAVARLSQSRDVVSWDLDDGSFTSLVAGRARSVQLTLHVARASAAAPVLVDINADGRQAANMRVTSPDWQTVILPLADGLAVRLRGMHRIDVHAAGAEAVVARGRVTIHD